MSNGVFFWKWIGELIVFNELVLYLEKLTQIIGVLFLFLSTLDVYLFLVDWFDSIMEGLKIGPNHFMKWVSCGTENQVFLQICEKVHNLRIS